MYAWSTFTKPVETSSREEPSMPRFYGKDKAPDEPGLKPEEGLKFHAVDVPEDAEGHSIKRGASDQRPDEPDMQPDEGIRLPAKDEPFREDS